MSRRKPEEGFALLLVFAMASILAITLYLALPRVAFESERDREQLLIQRGEQYSRAIQLYVRKTKRFPGKIEDLENTNGIRFLRRRYVDPMTGKEEWRLIHAGPGGTLIDSLVQKQSKDKKEAKVVDNFITELAPLGGAHPTDVNTNVALRHRPSDQAGAPGSTSAGPIPPDPGTGGVPAQITPAPAAAGANLPPKPPAASTSGISVMPSFGALPSGAPAPPPILQPGLQMNNPAGTAPGIMPGTAPGTAPGTTPGPTDATRLIQNLLVTPRPGGLAGINGAQQPAGQIIGGGIAGVASNYKGQGIKIYHDQDEFPKWEFVYDLAKDPSMNPTAALPQAAPPPGTPIGGAAAAPAASLSAVPTPAAPPVPVPPQ